MSTTTFTTETRLTPKDFRRAPASMTRLPEIVRTCSDIDLVAAGIETPEQLAFWFEAHRCNWFKYNTNRKCWMVCLDGMWEIDDRGYILGAIRALMRRMVILRDNATFLKKTLQWRFAKDTLNFLESNLVITCSNPDFDRDPFILGTPGGLVDLRTGITRPAVPADMVLRRTRVMPAQTTNCPMWKQFLAETTEGQPGLEDYLQRFAGYCLTGDTSHEFMTFIHGRGGNGKGVFLRTISMMMGDYSMASSPDNWLRRSHQDHPEWMARLDGARLVTVSELPVGEWNFAQIKAWTGNETPIVARFMYGKNFEFMPTGKVVFTSNDKPEIGNVDEGVVRRMRLIHFGNRPKVPDATLKTRLEAEMPEILRWAIEGCQKYLAEGMDMPDGARASTAEYLRNEDLTRRIVDEWFEYGVPEARFLMSDTRNVIAAWLHDAGIQRKVTNHKLVDALEGVGATPSTLRGARAYAGVRLNETGWAGYRRWAERFSAPVARREPDRKTGCPGWGEADDEDAPEAGG